jgi:undecaprenyl-diphosphatase
VSIIENIIYGFISGITDFLPVSSCAHQTLLRYILGVDSRNFLQEFLVHIGLLLSIFVCCRDVISRLRREQKYLSRLGYRKKKSLDPKSNFDIRLLKTASIPLIIGLYFSFVTAKNNSNLLSVMGFLILNGIVLFIADHTQRGNRDSRTMTGLDGIIMGILGSLSVFPGISRTGMISAYAAARGADFENVTNWAFLLGIPALIFLLCFDLFGIITLGAGIISFSVLIGYILAGISAFIGGYIAISALKAFLNHAGFSQFAYYSFGAAFLTFIIYLIT